MKQFFLFKKNILLLSLGFVLGINVPLWAQEWIQLKENNANFYDIKKSFENEYKQKKNKYNKKVTIEKEEGGEALFKRWAWYAEPRVYPSGDLKYASFSYALEQYHQWLNENSVFKTSSGGAAVPTATTANWVPLGPFGDPIGSNAGRLVCVRFHPTNPNIIYVGTAAGGMWVSTNGGSTWTTTTDNLGSLGVSDIAIDPSNPNIIYIATGDYVAGDTYSIGVYKSTDGGLTWNSTGLSFTTNLGRRIGRLLINPLNPTTLFAFTSQGIYRTRNGGNTWTLVQSGNFKDGEYKPGDTTVIYGVTSSGFYRSTNGGNSFSTISYGAVGSVIRLSIAVTPANPNYVYLLASASDYSYGGVYRSTSMGAAGTWSVMSTTPNIFDWSTNGSGTGGQGWYDLAIGVSPTNANEIICGGVNTWKSTNGGSTWTLYTHWYGGGGKPYVHADLHDVQYTSSNTVYLATDGGLFKTTNGGSSFTAINGNMNIAQIYKLGLSATSSSLIVTGHQDNGTNKWNGTTWTNIYGGDGMDCFISWNNNNTIVASYVYGDFQRSTNGGVSWTSIAPSTTENAAWVAPIIQHPTNPNTFLCGYENVWISNNQGTSWTKPGTIGSGSGDILGVKVAPSNTTVIYAFRSNALYRSSNNGALWTDISSGLPVGSAAITDIAIDNTNENNIYVTFSGYSSGNKVFHSTNGGASWTNYSTGLPNIPVNCIVYTKNSSDAIYVGTDVGVYYRELSMSSWLPYSQGLPNVIVSDLEIDYLSNKLRAATYGRGVWETSLYSNPTATPNSFFTTTYSIACINTPFQLTDASSNNPTSWSWSFPGGNPSSSSLQNPSVTYTATGTYTISLTASNSNGTGTTYTSTITVAPSPTAASSSTTVCMGYGTYIYANTNASSVSWNTGANTSSVYVNPTITTVYSYTAANGQCQSTANVTVNVAPTPPQPTVSVSGGTLTCSPSAASYQWYLNGSPITGATSQTYLATQNGYYSVWISNTAGCQSSSSSVYVTVTGVQNFTSSYGIKITPNPATNFIEINSSEKQSLLVKINDLTGKELYVSTFDFKQSDKYQIDISKFESGIYLIEITGNDFKVKEKIIKN
ncbi:MAG: T9SS type A sorting domain-containing protein [Bacteroidia bacterium]|nr:T9SS type A sorting domain-containing protein [Bacteroidia bacterium]